MRSAAHHVSPVQSIKLCGVPAALLLFPAVAASGIQQSSATRGDPAFLLTLDNRSCLGSNNSGKIESSSFLSRLRGHLFFKGGRGEPRPMAPGARATAQIAAGGQQQQQDQDLQEASTTKGSVMTSQSTYYLSHGSPMLPLEDLPARAFFENLPKSFPDRPKAILMVSGHWDTREPMVTTAAKLPTIYDFYGFPQELYRLSYTPPGAPAVGHRVKQLLQEAGFPAGEDKRRGVDHGAWVPLLLMFPDAGIPVLQLSIQSHRNAAYHYKLGQALQPLRDEGVLIIGSGSAVHNLRELGMNFSPDGGASGATQSWAKDFDEFIRDSLVYHRFEDVVHYETKAPHAKRAHPSNDHFVPLLVALGAAGESAKAELIHSSWSYGCLSYSSYAFRPQQ